MKGRRALVIAWLALLVLLALSAASVQVQGLGRGLLAISLAIAALKAAIVGSVFMGLRERRPLLRLVVACGLAALLVLGLLSQVDGLARRDEPTPWQSPPRDVTAHRMQAPSITPDGGVRPAARGLLRPPAPPLPPLQSVKLLDQVRERIR